MVIPPCRAMHKEGQQPVPLTDPLSQGNPLCSPSLAQSHLCHSPSHWLGAIFACSPCCRSVRHLFASFPLHCHSTRLLASCLWPTALLLTPGHVGLLPGLLGFPILTEHFPAKASAAATFHSKTKHVLTASGIPSSSFLAPRAVHSQTQLTRCTSHCTTCSASSHPRCPLGSGPSCACSNSPFHLSHRGCPHLPSRTAPWSSLAKGWGILSPGGQNPPSFGPGI